MLGRAGEGSQRITRRDQSGRGVRAEVNDARADSGANVEDRVLGAWGHFGCAVTDVGGGVTDAVIEQLASLPTTIRVRQLG
mgnify:CR=1 FL=1